MTAPKRIQRKRTRGWRTPLCSCGSGHRAIYVGRGTRWGNPFVIGRHVTRQMVVDRYRHAVITGWPGFPSVADIRAALRGHDLVCWCGLDQACHGDLHLDLANQEDFHA